MNLTIYCLTSWLHVSRLNCDDYVTLDSRLFHL